MKRMFFDVIRTGQKTTTLRYWKSCRVKPGSTHTVPGLGKVLIQSVQPIDPDQLTAADAVADGFATLRALREALDGMYDAQTRSERQLFKITFKLLPASQGHDT